MSGTSGGGGRDSDDWPFKAPVDGDAQIAIEPSPPRPPEEVAAEAAKREETLRNLVKTGLAAASAKLTEVDRRGTATSAERAKPDKPG